MFDPLSDPEERAVLHAALDSFRQYRHAAHYNVTHLRRQAFYSLPYAHIDLLAEPPFSLPKTFEAVDDAIDSNGDIAEAILAFGVPAFGIADDSWKGHATPSDMDKARLTICQLYREWSVEGLSERHASFSPILSALETHLPKARIEGRHHCRILVPGAGLGRLVFELYVAGYTVEGNEISYHQLLASNYILNGTQSAGQHKLYPFALTFTNHLKRSDQLRAVAVPDIHPATILQEAQGRMPPHMKHIARMSMSAGDFCALYRRPEYESCFDAVTTCFFIDTAPNLINYIEAVKHCLRPGAVWINLGPLLWHFDAAPHPAHRRKSTASSHPQRDEMGDNETGEGYASGIGQPGSFELSNDEVHALVRHFGFDITDQAEMPAGAAGYNQDSASMLQDIYRPSFWVAKKR
ncbi:hypothetical protein BAUCODRAFT_282873 [Baudoinia panamericana UAMH 10762]|uniref:carnosine N-methyltransferase n=1 Tax=Baudoinia panamericana (strain UAMH 10762) TaxID=717646 RepID=M2M7E5_BAUPA|nr:uncharacterized protein BAUCODRAFT_282873 [Baudoinia panamericana UAMH 10762]EMC92236.1 hypothetical protein BAUCODRAFT_282873 [Baudoinia panamericana UAMH 10762]